MSLISYIKTIWANGSTPAINAGNLNKIEAGIDAVTEEVLSHLAEIVTVATANKILKLNADKKLPASITGDADTVDGIHANIFSQSRGLVGDASNALEDGGYLILAGALNFPPMLGGWATLYTMTGGTGGMIQLAVQVDGIRAAIRHFDGAHWYPWSEIYLSTSKPAPQNTVVTRNLALSGIQTISGLNGKPKKIMIRAIVPNQPIMSIGVWTENGTQSSIAYFSGTPSYIDTNGYTVQLGKSGSGTLGLIQNVANGSFGISWVPDGTGTMLAMTGNLYITVDY